MSSPSATGAAPLSERADAPRSTVKACFVGTHRVCAPEETLERIRPVFPHVGITRLADVTWLDDIGIPVFQAVRPDARTLSVSQGKGLTSALAKVSAAMESIEIWHAEHVPRGVLVAAAGDVSGKLDYELRDLPRLRWNCLNEHTMLEWSVARALGSGDATLIPTALLRLDARILSSWQPPTFEASSNGLASGNTFEEAILHGLYELVERDAIARAVETNERFRVPPETVDGASAMLLSQFARAGVEVFIDALPSRFGLPCFRVYVWSDTFPTLFSGSGCHRDRDVSLCRALTEAAQSRTTAIAGTRDDIRKGQYRRSQQFSGRPDAEQTRPKAWRAFDDIQSTTALHLEEDFRALTACVERVLGRSALVVEHTRPDIGVPVVHVVCPGMRFDAEPE